MAPAAATGMPTQPCSGRPTSQPLAVDELSVTNRQDRSALEAAAAQGPVTLESSIALIRLKSASEVVDLAEALWNAIARFYQSVWP